MDQIARLLDNCHSPDPVKQREAVNKLARLHAVHALPEILSLLTSPDEDVQEASIHALEALGTKDPERVVPALLAVLHDLDWYKRMRAVQALGHLSSPSALEPLKTLLHTDPNETVRASAAEALGSYSNEAVLSDLEQALSDEDESVRVDAARSIGLIASPAFLPHLLAHIASASTMEERLALVAAAYRLGSREHLEELLQMLQRADEDSTIAVLMTLIDLTKAGLRLPPTVRQDVLRLREVLRQLEQRSPFSKAHVQKILHRLIELEGNHKGDGFQKQQDHYPLNAQETIYLLQLPTEAHNALVKLFAEDAPLQVLLQALQQSADPALRGLFCHLLGERKDLQAVPALIHALHDADAHVRAEAAEALDKIGDERAGEALMQQYLLENDENRALFAGALAGTHYLPAVPYLVDALASNDAILRASASAALRYLEAREAIQPLTEALAKETSAYVREEMQKALTVLKALYND
jgi:HEAT repeat protein